MLCVVQKWFIHFPIHSSHEVSHCSLMFVNVSFSGGLLDSTAFPETKTLASPDGDNTRPDFHLCGLLQNLAWPCELFWSAVKCFCEPKSMTVTSILFLRLQKSDIFTINASSIIATTTKPHRLMNGNLCCVVTETFKPFPTRVSADPPNDRTAGGTWQSLECFTAGSVPAMQHSYKRHLSVEINEGQMIGVFVSGLYAQDPGENEKTKG